jgi:asparagine N-glycosylation enzyme membrane subunit Stt3
MLGLRFSRLRWPEWMIGAGGVVLAAAMLLAPWYTHALASGPPGPRYFATVTVDGWHGLSGGRWVMVLTVLAAFAVVFFQARQRAPALPVAFTLIASLLATVTLIWLIVRVWIVPPGGREVGGWIGLLAAAAIAYAGHASLRLEGIAPDDAPADIPTLEVGAPGPGG